MQRDELAAWLRLTLTPGIGNVTARKLLGAFGLPQAIFCQPAVALQQLLSAPQVQALRQVPSELAELLETTWNWLQVPSATGLRRQLLSLGDAAYPRALLALADPPLLLYTLGQGTFAQPGQTAGVPVERVIDAHASLAIVGSRNPSAQGLINARQFAQGMVQAGLTVVSGLALGIDGAAHQGALDGAAEAAQAATLAVVGTGLDRVYPRAHRALAHRIAEQGLLLSEYPLGTPPLTLNFPKRNRLIAALAQGTLVVEAALKSGSLITARLACEQGKEVFAVPGSIHAVQARGCHALIKQGAKLVESVSDVLEELHLRPGHAAPVAASASKANATNQELFDADPSLYDALGYDPVGLDALQARTGLDAAQLQAQLMGLELDGQVARLPGGLFQRLSA